MTLADIQSMKALKQLKSMGTLSADSNSLILGDLHLKYWSDQSSSLTVRIAPYYDTDGTYQDLLFLNPERDAVNYANRSTRFVTPTGTSSVTFSVPMKLPSGVASGWIKLAILSSNGNTVLASQICALTTTLTSFSITANVSANTEYMLSIFARNDDTGQNWGQNQAIMGRPSLTVVSSNSFFNGNFERFSITPDKILDNINGVYDSTSKAYNFNPFSRYVFHTNAKQIAVEAVSTIVPNYPQYATIGVKVNDRPYQTLQVTVNNTLTSFLVTLPDGVKKVELSNGLQSKPSTTIVGTWLRSVYVTKNSITIPINHTVTRRLSVYGDSITVGANTANPLFNGVQMLVRGRYPGNVLIEGYGYRSFNDDASTATARQTFARKMADNQPNDLWIAIGTNDYGLNKWNATDFGTTYASFLDDLHSFLPNTRIYCQTPLLRGTETANTFGNTLGDYRTQISNAVSSRSPWAILVDGTAILTIPDLDTADNIHPTTRGHAKYATSVLSTLGY